LQQEQVALNKVAASKIEIKIKLSVILSLCLCMQPLHSL